MDEQRIREIVREELEKVKQESYQKVLDSLKDKKPVASLDNRINADFNGFVDQVILPGRQG